MTILSRFDAWLGKTLFHPPIILLCQITRQSQYAIYQALWFLAACHATYHMMSRGVGWGWVIYLWLWAMAYFISAAIYPDRPVQRPGLFRFVFWSFFFAGVAASLISGGVTSSTVGSLIILFAEYAATIRTIPPRRKRERRASGKEARI